MYITVFSLSSERVVLLAAVLFRRKVPVKQNIFLNQGRIQDFQNKGGAKDYAAHITSAN